MGAKRSARLLAVLEGLGIDADAMAHLAPLMRERERERAEDRTAELAEVMWGPSIGAIRARRREETS